MDLKSDAQPTEPPRHPYNGATVTDNMGNKPAAPGPYLQQALHTQPEGGCCGAVVESLGLARLKEVVGVVRLKVRQVIGLLALEQRGQK